MSNMGQGHWLDRMFKKKLSSYELTPSDHVWENIAKHLDGEKRRPFLYGYWNQWMWVLVFVGVLAGLFAWWWWNKQHTHAPGKNPMDLPYQNTNTANEGLAVHVSNASPQHATKQTLSTNQKSEPYTRKQVFTKKATPKNNQLSVTGFSNSANKNYTQNINEAVSVEGNHQQTTSESPVISPATMQSNDAPEQYIVSSDPSFFTLSAQTKTVFSFDRLPGRSSALKSEKGTQTFARMPDGCNVYMDQKSHFFVDAYYAPELARRSFSVSDPTQLDYAEKRAATEKPVLSYSMGLRGSVIFSNGLAFRTGIIYSNNKERFDYLKETKTITIERKDKDGNVIGVETQVIEIMDHVYNQYRQFDLPFIIGYEKDLKDFVLSINTGIGFNLSSNQSGKIYQQDQQTILNIGNNGEGSGEVFRQQLGMSFIASLGLNYKYNERIMLLLEPSARMYMKPITADAYPLKQKYSFFGLNAGIRYRID